MNLNKLFKVFLIIGLAMVLISPGVNAINIGGQAELNLKYNIDNNSFTETIKFSPYLRSWLGADSYFESEINFILKAQELDYNLEKLQLTYYGLNTDFIIGLQEVNWGAVDGNSPVDNINPRDYRRAGFSNEKVPVPAFRLKNYQQSFELDLVWQPVFVPARLPDIQENSLVKEDLENSLRNSTLGLRLTRSTPDYDLGASIYRGPSGRPVPVIDDFSNEIVLKYYIETVLGAEAVVELGSSIIRTDIAIALPESGEFLPDNMFRYALSLERNLSPDIFILAGFHGEIESGSAGENYLFINGDYQIDFYRNIDITAIYETDTGDYLLRPSFSYNLTDGVNLEAGALLSGGNDKSYNMNLDNQVYLKTTMSF